jgi:serine/threonine protein kinase
MVSLFSDIKKLVSSVGQFSSAIRGNTNDFTLDENDPRAYADNNSSSDCKESVDQQDHYNDSSANVVSPPVNKNYNNIPKPTLHTKTLHKNDNGVDDNNNNNSTTMSRVLEKQYPDVYSSKSKDGKKQLYTRKKRYITSSNNNNNGTSSTISFAPSATSSWSSVGSNSSTTSTRAIVLGLNDAVVELDDYEYAGVVGRGHSSTVILLQHRVTGVHYALKIIKRKTPRAWYVESVEKELHASLDHPFICPLLHSFVTYEERCYVLPFAAGGSMRNCIRNYRDWQNPHHNEVGIFKNNVRGQMPHKLARFYITEIVSALKYLHDKNVVYHDLKPENILIDQTGHLLLCDFGLSMSNVNTLTGAGRSFRGTPKYVAPEVILRRDHGTVIDSWSLGILIYEIYFGIVPFRASSRRELYQRICGGKIRFPKLRRKEYADGDDEEPRRRSRRAVSDVMIQSQRIVQPNGDGDDILDNNNRQDHNYGLIDDHATEYKQTTSSTSIGSCSDNRREEDPFNYLPVVKDMISQLLRRNPVNRLTIEELIEHEYFENINWVDVYNLKIAPPQISRRKTPSSENVKQGGSAM